MSTQNIGLGLRLICSKFYRLFFFYSPIITNYSRIIPVLFFSNIASIRSQLRLHSECLHQNINYHFRVYLHHLWWSLSPSSSHFLISCHLPFRLFLYHARECPIILILCLWVSYYSGIMLAKTVTYNSQNNIMMAH